MVPHSLFVTSDRQFDLALSMLTWVVGAALVMSLIALLVVTLTRPPPDRGDVGPPRWAAMPESLIDPWQLEYAPLMPHSPEQSVVFRCDRNGRTTYSDAPCAGVMRIVIPQGS